MDRHEFLKTGVRAAFGAMLAWFGVGIPEKASPLVIGVGRKSALIPTEPLSIEIPLWHPAGGFGWVRIDRDLWVEGNTLASLHRQISRSQAEGEDMPYWVLEAVGLEPHHGIVSGDIIAMSKALGILGEQP